MKIFLSRHGETQETKSGILQWHLPWKLTEHGISQAQKLAERMRNEVIDIIISSDLARAYDPAKEVSKNYSNLPFLTSKLLQERSFWVFEWKKKSEIGFYDPAKQGLFTNPENGETLTQVYQRAESFFGEIFSKYQDKKILIVTHDDLWKALIAVILWKQLQEVKSIPKASLSIFTIDEKWNANIELYGDTQHLEE